LLVNESTEENDELYEHHRIVVDPGQQALRIDKFLQDRLPNTSRVKIQEGAKQGYVKVDGKAVKPNYKVKGGEIVTVELPNPVREIELIPEDIPLDIAYEDDHVIVIDKPAGRVVHPGYGNYSGTIVNAMVFHFKQLAENTQHGVPRPGLVHRLDKNTTGLLIFAKDEKSLAHLSNQFFERTTSRRYTALVWGDVEEDGTVDVFIGRSLQNRKVMTTFPDEDYGKHAVTHYKVLERFGYVTLIECKLETGRTHQIRIHMKSIGHPLFNDSEYGGDKILKGTTFSKYQQYIRNCFEMCPRHALHARSLGFEHPKTGKRIELESNLPSDMEQLIDKWRRYTANRKDL